MGFMPLLKNELRELFINLRILYIPIVFTLLTLTQPITMKMLPSLLKSNKLPPGSVVHFTQPSATTVMGTLLDKFGSLGIIVIVLITMGEIASERSTGVAAMVLVKPIRYANYFLTKVIASSALVAVSIFVAMAISTYYTEVMFGEVDWLGAMLGTLLYLPNLLLVVAITLCASALLKSQVAAGAISFIINLILNVVPQYLGDFLKSVSPDQLLIDAGRVVSGASNISFGRPIIGVIVLILLFYATGILVLNRQEV